MSNDLIAWVIVVALSAVVVVVGLRRNLSDSTRSGVLEFESASEEPTAMAAAPSHLQRDRRPMSPQKRRSIVGSYLLLAVAFAVVAVVETNNRVFSALFAATWAFNAVVTWVRSSPSASDGPTS